MPSGVYHRKPQGRTITERFWAFVDKTSECWLWKGTISPGGYGYFSIKAGISPKRAHRYSWEVINGMVPEGLQLDHVCRVRNCVNPAHLRAITQKENTLCGLGITALNAKKTHCSKGHPLFGDNLSILTRGGGERVCKTCRKEATLAYLSRKSRNKESK